jgi:hypothetical protein
MGVANRRSLDNNCDGRSRAELASPDYASRPSNAILPKKNDKQYDQQNQI